MRARFLAGLVLHLVLTSASYAATTCPSASTDGDPIRISDPQDGITSHNPAVAWNGTRFAVVTAGEHLVGERYEQDVFFQLLGRSGQPVTARVPLTDTPGDSVYEASVVWTGREFGVVWDDDIEINFARVDASGNRIAPPVALTGDPAFSFWPSLAWHGSGYGVAWEEYRDGVNGEIYFARFDDAGRRIGQEVRVTTDPAESWFPSVVWTGSEFGLVWADGRSGSLDLYFTRIGSNGQKLGGDIRLTTGGVNVNFRPALAWTGQGYGVAWTQFDSQRRTVRLTVFDAAGGNASTPFVTDTETSDSEISLVWIGQEFGLVWNIYDVAANTLEVRLARLGPDGGRLQADVAVATGAWAVQPAVAWGGLFYGTVYWDPQGGQELFFRRVGCACVSTVDGDADGSPACADCDDARADVHPGAVELCDGLDQDCDDDVDEGVTLCGVGGCARAVPLCTAGEPSTCTPGPPVSETCDTIDNDCDGTVDEVAGCATTCEAPDVASGGATITSPPFVSGYFPSLAWSGDGYGVAWMEYDNADRSASSYRVRFARLDGSLNVVSQMTLPSSSSSAGPPELVWNGDEFGLVYQTFLNLTDPNQIFFARIARSGTLAAAPTQVSQTTGFVNFATVAWTGSEYGVAWEDSRHGPTELYFTRITPQGQRIGDELRVTNTPGYSYEPSLTWTGSDYALTWEDDTEGRFAAYFLKLDSNGTPRHAPVKIASTSADVYTPVAVWNGSEFGVAWYDVRDEGSIRFTRVDPFGARLGPDILLAPAYYPGIDRYFIWTGDEYALTYTESRDVFVARFDRAGVSKGVPLRVARSPRDYASAPSLVWTGAAHTVALESQSDPIDGGLHYEGDIELRTTRCDCPDADGDTISVCYDCDDARASTFPGRPEICANGIDDNCNALNDETAGADTDGDSIDDLCDVCPFRADPLQGDGDHDARGDVCDVCPLQYDPRQEDADLDGVGDVCDGCKWLAHPQATDADGDGTGDVCDVNDGGIFIVLPEENRVAWDNETGFNSSFNLYRGDIAILRASGIYTQSETSPPYGQRTCGIYAYHGSFADWPDADRPEPGRAYFYLANGWTPLGESSLGTDSAGNERPNTAPCP